MGGPAPGDALVLLLRARYHRLASDGVFPRALLTTAVQVGKTPTRAPALLTKAGGVPVMPRTRVVSQQVAGTAFVFCFRLLSSARPLGP